QDGPELGAQAVEAYLSEDAMQILYGRDMDIGELGQNEVRIGVFLNEERDLIGIADMPFDVGEPNRRPYWSLQLGPRAYGALMALEDQDVFSIGLGGRLSYFLGRNRASSVALTAFYAPDIVTFGNADNIKDVSVSVETRLSESTNLFIGYRVFEFDLAVDRAVDDNLHVGIRHRFCRAAAAPRRIASLGRFTGMAIASRRLHRNRQGRARAMSTTPDSGSGREIEREVERAKSDAAELASSAAE